MFPHALDPTGALGTDFSDVRLLLTTSNVMYRRKDPHGVVSRHANFTAFPLIYA